jgi:PBSX family phage terminase large subunit
MAATLDVSNPELWAAKYLPVLTKPRTYNVLWGGAGSGKSQTMIQLFLAEICNHNLNQNQTFFVIRKVATTLRNSVFADFRNKIADWGIEGLVRMRSGYLEVVSGTNKIVFLGCDDPEKLKSLSQAKAIWIEEATELTIDDFTQITLRLRGRSKQPKRFYLTFNPVSDSHWIKGRFFDKPPEAEKDSILTLHGTYLDALDFLDDDYPTRMEALRDVSQTYYEVYALGQWGVWDRESLFASSFEAGKHSLDAVIKALPSLPLYLAFDFNVTNTCVVAQYQKNTNDADNYGTVNVLKVYRVGDLSTLCQTIRAEYPNFTYIVNGDASGASRSAFTQDNINAYQLIVNYLNVSDLQIQVPRSNPSHIASRLVTILFFQKCIIRISQPNCGILITDLKEAKVDRNGSLDPWKRENPDKSHALDAFRYFVFSNFADITNNYNLEKFNAGVLL